MEILSDEELQQLTAQVAESLLKQAWMLSSAESCTGGWVAKCCTDLAGSSAWFDCGFITYSNQAKQSLLNVHTDTLEQSGAVSEQTVIEMAQAALHNSNANISVAISGIAGPDGGTDKNPVGTVWLAWATKTSAQSEHHHFSGNRDEIRRQAVTVALKGIVKNSRDQS